MSNVGPEGKSKLPINMEDLKRLAKIARDDLECFFKENSRWAALYADRVRCFALCQGAAKHFVDGKEGINDFDVYTFFETNPKKPWYAKRIKAHDFGDPKFGKSVDNPKKTKFIGRRVDCMGRDIDFANDGDVVMALRRYLEQGKTPTARYLAMKAVVLLDPRCGTIVWK